MFLGIGVKEKPQDFFQDTTYYPGQSMVTESIYTPGRK